MVFFNILKVLAFLNAVQSLHKTYVEDSGNPFFELARHGLYAGGVIEIVIGNLEVTFQNTSGEIQVAVHNSKTLSKSHKTPPLEDICLPIDSHVNMVTKGDFSVYKVDDMDYWTKEVVAPDDAEGWYTVYLINCKSNTKIEFWSRVNIYQQKGHNFLSAGDYPTPYMYILICTIQHLVSLYWLITMIQNKKSVKTMHKAIFVTFLMAGLETTYYAVKTLFMSFGIDAIEWNVDIFTSDLFRLVFYVSLSMSLYYGLASIQQCFPPEKFKKIFTFTMVMYVLDMAYLYYSDEFFSLNNRRFGGFWLFLANTVYIIWLFLAFSDSLNNIPHNTEAFKNKKSLRYIYTIWGALFILLCLFVAVVLPFLHYLNRIVYFTYSTWLAVALLYFNIIALEGYTAFVFKKNLSSRKKSAVFRCEIYPH